MDNTTHNTEEEKGKSTQLATKQDR